MRAAWRLTLNGLSARPSRTALLTSAVALSAALVGAVACALASVNQTVALQLDERLGSAEARIRPAGRGQTLDPAIVETARQWGGVEFVRPVAQVTVALAFETTLLAESDAGGSFVRDERPLGATAVLNGLDPEPGTGGGALDRLRLIAGRLPEADGEIVIDALLAERLGGAYATDPAVRASFAIGGGKTDYLDEPPPDLPDTTDDAALAEQLNSLVGPRLGDTLLVVRFLRERVPLTVVGIAEPPPLGGRPQGYGSLATAALASRGDPGLSEIELELAIGVDADAFVDAHDDELGSRVLVQTTERITSGVEKNLSSNRIGFLLTSALAFLSAAFIILTGLTTGMAEQQRSLAVLRCIGATRRQLAQAQLLTGLAIGAMGAAIGIPLGVAMAWTLITVFEERVPGGLAVPPGTLTVSVFGAVLAGLAGSLWPAWRAATLTPLEGLAARAVPPSRRVLLLTTLVGAFGLAIQATAVVLPGDGQTAFWSYITLGLPAMFIGYFFLSVPVVVLVSRAAGPLVTRALRLPPRILERTVGATPYRFGFTAGAMMTGLALMVAIWTNGGAFMRDWIGRIQFPDAFVSGLALTPDDQARVDELPFVDATCAITIHPVRVEAFGVRALQNYRTSFVAFETEPFFEMVSVEWVQGEPEYGRRRLTEGGAVIVAREFLVAQGLGAGDMFVCRDAQDNEHEFEIVGVITSPGLELVSKFFNIGDEFMDQALHAVFGSRRDLRERFGSEAIQLIQIDLADDADDAEAVVTIRESLFGSGVLDAGSGRQIKAQLIEFVAGSLVVFSAVAIGAMGVASLGVANLVIAGINARRFEFGVLRAIGGSRSVLVRLILAEALVVAIAASIVGTAMGMQGAWAGQRLYGHLLGISLNLVPPIVPIALGWAFVIALTLAAAAPAIMRLNREQPKDLLRTVA